MQGDKATNMQGLLKGNATEMTLARRKGNERIGFRKTEDINCCCISTFEGGREARNQKSVRNAGNSREDTIRIEPTVRYSYFCSKRMWLIRQSTEITRNAVNLKSSLLNDLCILGNSA